jgi:plasmid stabilization system protein ParE
VAERRSQLKAVLSAEARRDLRDTLRWSETKFGRDAALRYEALLVQALRDIENNPARHGATERPGIMIKGARTYRFSRGRAKTSLASFCRETGGDQLIETWSIGRLPLGGFIDNFKTTIRTCQALPNIIY